MDASIDSFLKQARDIVRTWCNGDLSTADASSQILSLAPDIDDDWLSRTIEKYAAELSNNKLSSDSQRSKWRMLVLTMQDCAVDSGWEPVNKILYGVYKPADKKDAASDAYSVSIQVDNGNVLLRAGNPILEKALEKIISSYNQDIKNDEYLEKLAKEMPKDISGFKRLSLGLEKQIAQPWCPEIW